MGFGFDIGLEKRKQLGEKLNLLYGADLISSVSLYRYTGNSNLDYEWGAGLVLGLQYIISNSFSLSAELVPSFIYEFSKNTTTANGYERKIKNNAYHIILNNNNTNLTLAYRLVK